MQFTLKEMTQGRERKKEWGKRDKRWRINLLRMGNDEKERDEMQKRK